MSDSLKQKTFSGLLWNFVENFSLQGFGFIQGIILARLLTPSDYGLIAMVGVFFSISHCLIDSGFTSALIRKKNRTDIDYSTVYVTNITLSFFFALILYICSAYIANFYKEPLLEDIVKINAILLFLGAFIAVQGTRLTINLEFKTKSIINVVATIITGITTIILAILDFGVWALIYPNFISLVIRGYLYWYYQHWVPKLNFSLNSFYEFFNFGYKLLATNLLISIYNNIYSLIIGKKYNSTEVGYYSKAEGYPALISGTVTGVIGKTTFPVLCQLTDNMNILINVYRKMTRMTCFLVFPLLMGLCALAKPLIIILITEKWEASITYMQILCFAIMLNPISQLNYNLLSALGKSDYIFKVELYKRIICVLILFISIPFGIKIACIGYVFSSFISIIINFYYIYKTTKISINNQVKDIIPFMLYSISMLIIILLANKIFNNYVHQLTIGLIIGTTYYFIISYFTKSPELNYIKSLTLNYFQKVKSKCPSKS